ncbi:alpha/beta fold hydrolase [Streptomyces lincolnensis]|uniref:alpha/beta fold hydrolase n=1 Tax=Streptomyces lincolnensis TaxID=1915 RepID=UPI0037D77611
MTDISPRQTHVTSADGTAIAVTVTGQGRPLVVSPGALCTAQDWQLLADVLAPHMSTYAVDRRGHGASGDSPDFSIEREQEDIAAVLELAGPDAILLGHSYGGLVTLGLALGQPPAGFILYEPPVPLHGPVGGAALAPFEEAVQKGDLDLALVLGLRNFLKLPEEAIEAFRREPVWSVRASMTPTWAREVRAMDAFGDDLERFARLETPTLLVVGELSPPWLTDTSRRLMRSLPNGSVVEIPGQAHDAYLTDPAAMAEAILPFALKPVSAMGGRRGDITGTDGRC